MIWVVLAILVVGYFIVQAINKGSSTKPSKLLPIAQRINMVKELDDKLQAYVGNAYKEELEEHRRLRHNKDPKYSWKTWDKESEDMYRKNYEDFCNMVELNSRLCQKLGTNEQALLDQLADWGTYLEQLRDILLDKIGTDDFINAGLDIPYDEVQASERAGIIREALRRMMDRARSSGITDKKLVKKIPD